MLPCGIQHALKKRLINPEGRRSQGIEFGANGIDEAFTFRAKEDSDGSCFTQPEPLCSVASSRLIEKHEVGIDLMSKGEGVSFSSIEGLPQQSSQADVLLYRGHLQPTGLAG